MKNKNIIKKMNKKGATFQIFMEVIFFSVLFVIALGIIGSNMNSLYSDNKDLSFGIVTNSTIANLESTQASLDSSQKEGQSSFSSLGLFTITTLPKMIGTIFSTAKDFVTGAWIASLVNLMNLGEYTQWIILVFRILYFIILIFILIKIITRITI